MTQSTNPSGVAISRPEIVPFWAKLFSRNEPSPPPLNASVTFVSDVGCVRDNNEDSFGYNNPNEGTLVAVVADGMGGHACGEYASKLAVELVLDTYRRSQRNPEKALEKAVLAANAGIYREAKKDAAKRSMGTTCTAIAVVGKSLRIGHVGDSRLYLVRGGRAYQLSQDHTQIAEWVAEGILTPEEGKHHPDRNVLSRAVGTKPVVQVECWEDSMRLQIGDILVLCSDGLHDLVDEDEIARICKQSGKAACDDLIALAKSRGAPDNVTAGVIQILDDRSDESLKETR